MLDECYLLALTLTFIEPQELILFYKGVVISGLPVSCSEIQRRFKNVRSLQHISVRPIKCYGLCPHFRWPLLYAFVVSLLAILPASLIRTKFHSRCTHCYFASHRPNRGAWIPKSTHEIREPYLTRLVKGKFLHPRNHFPSVQFLAGPILILTHSVPSHA